MTLESGISQARMLAGGLALFACGEYWIAEAVSASAWHEPPYSYAINYISDLGVRDCGPKACSPLFWVMSGGIASSGILAAVGAWLLAPLLAPLWLRLCAAGLATAHAIGSVLVATVPSAPGSAAGTPLAHFIGAYLAVLGGNLALIACGAGLPRSRGGREWHSPFASEASPSVKAAAAMADPETQPSFRTSEAKIRNRRFTALIAAFRSRDRLRRPGMRDYLVPWLPIALGLLGLVGAVMLTATGTRIPGFYERVAVDSITAGEVFLGAAALIAAVRRSGPTG